MMNLEDFIEELGKIAVDAYPKYKILPSLCIAQALLESNKADYKKGMLKLSGLASDCWNLFGMKWNSTCGTDKKAYKTKEQNPDGSYVEIVSYFRKYPTMRDGIIGKGGYMEFLTGYKRYANLVGNTDWNSCCDLIRQDGWATSLTYSQNLKTRIKDLQLYRFDEKVIKNAPIDKKPTIRKGQRDSQLGANYIESWQRYLSLLGFKCDIDGIFGNETEKRINEYRAIKTLPINGLIDEALWNTLP